MAEERKTDKNREIDIKTGAKEERNCPSFGTVQDYCAVLKNSMTAERWLHSLGVAETAKKMAEFWGADPEKAWLAGIFHDYARELPYRQLMEIAQENGLDILDEERDNPVVLHAPVGAFLVKKDFSITDGEILSAISKHTVGGECLTLLDKIIFLADMVEPSRNWPGVDKLRAKVYQDLDQTMAEAIEGTIEYLQEKGCKVHPVTLKAWHQIKERETNRE
ncbi:MAG: bis(5'-nucleosyl)-tetraphosphatase (symmetrical) YqeK [Bacillota bacterium]|jgi:predicted HD superfamily hydrolase involved in NAD metabolism|nr:HD domain-containing protein [Clostridia bacterium]